MHFPKQLALATFGVWYASAAPMPVLTTADTITSIPAIAKRLETGLVHSGAQTCLATNHFWWNDYGLSIGVKPQNDADKASYCDNAHNQVFPGGEPWQYYKSWECETGEDGQLWIAFSFSMGHSAEINAGFKRAFGDEINGFNCPDY